jgi:hypothetical protein
MIMTVAIPRRIELPMVLINLSQNALNYLCLSMWNIS